MAVIKLTEQDGAMIDADKFIKAVLWLMAVVVLACLIGGAALFYFATTSLKNGIRPAIEIAWCGTPGCLFIGPKEAK